MSQQTVEPDAAAFELMKDMGSRHDIMREIVDETITSAEEGDIREAGRTKCPGKRKIKGPLQRFPRAIDLSSCSYEAGGAWHTHVTPDEMRSPVNSLPDMANVVFGLLDVSYVVGSEDADVIVAAVDRDAMIEEFQNAIGEAVESPQDVGEAIADRRIRPTQARHRAREALAPLLYTVKTGYDEFEERIGDISSNNWAHPAGSGGREAFTGNQLSAPVLNAQSFEDVNVTASGLLDNINIGALVVSTAIGTVVGGVVDRALFDN